MCNDRRVYLLLYQAVSRNIDMGDHSNPRVLHTATSKSPISTISGFSDGLVKRAVAVCPKEPGFWYVLPKQLFHKLQRRILVSLQFPSVLAEEQPSMGVEDTPQCFCSLQHALLEKQFQVVQLGSCGSGSG